MGRGLGRHFTVVALEVAAPRWNQFTALPAYSESDGLGLGSGAGLDLILGAGGGDGGGGDGGGGGSTSGCGNGGSISGGSGGVIYDQKPKTAGKGGLAGFQGPFAPG